MPLGGWQESKSGAFGTVPENFFEKKQLILALQPLLGSCFRMFWM